jgi:hypothetical protein
MLFYHRTPAADAILGKGFKDSTGLYITSQPHTGVWLSDVPLDENEGAKGQVVLAIDIPERVLVPYEWVEDGKGYREFLAPAKLVNRYGPPRIHDHDYRDWTREELLQCIAMREKFSSPAAVEEIAEMREALRFLKKHGLLAEPEPAPAPKKQRRVKRKA